MKRLLTAVMLTCALPALASNTTVTGTVTDTDGQVWFGGTFKAVLTVQGSTGSAQIPTVGGVAVPATVTGTMNGSGVFTATLTDTSTVDQANPIWTLTVCPQASVSALGATPCPTYVIRVVGATVNVTSTLAAVAAPRFPAGINAFGYLDAEVVTPAAPGVTYYNLTSGMKAWTGAGWATVGGASSICVNGGTYVCASGTYAGAAIPHSPAAGSTTLVAGSLFDDGTNLVYNGGGGIATFTGNYKIGDEHYFINSSGPQMQAGATSNGEGWIDSMATVFTQTSGFFSTREIGQTHIDFSPASGSASYAGLMVNPGVNATSTGTAYGMVVAPKFTAMTGGTKKLAGFGTSTGSEGTGYTEVAYIGTSGDIHPKVYAVSGLPSASTIGAGGVLLVSDSNVTTVGTCTGGGANYMTAISNGTTWVCH